ncbi:EamA family transporter [Streptomyces millisiae]|uniref:EamA family transporter n=1 Tax=Streptomyces millisiae TaxID=3075542 RepID=A0ABU2LZ67_9ACTN|nr:EamA family transporter [Streptomyces sp. DSM 44918]MDT0322861.1 EamA family transporter [Streptomyces sp. DSM 44918]
MGAVLALASAVCHGVVDFAGGLLSRRVHFAVVTFVGQLGGLALALLAALLVPADAVSSADLAWGALSGVGSGIAMHFLNRGLSRGAMSVVVPVSAVTGVALSVLCGVCLLGDRPTPLAWLGIVLTVPALWLVAGGDGEPRGPEGRASVDGLVASLGVAVQYLGLAQADPASGVWAVAAGRVAAVLILLPSAARHARHFRIPARPPGPVFRIFVDQRAADGARLARRRIAARTWPYSRDSATQPGGMPVVASPRGSGRQALAQAALIGAGAACGLILYLWATRQQMLAVAVVLASLYPAIPTVLGFVLLGERATRTQSTGLFGATAAIVLLTLG